MKEDLWVDATRDIIMNCSLLWSILMTFMCAFCHSDGKFSTSSILMLRINFARIGDWNIIRPIWGPKKYFLSFQISFSEGSNLMEIFFYKEISPQIWQLWKNLKISPSKESKLLNLGHAKASGALSFLA